MLQNPTCVQSCRKANRPEGQVELLVALGGSKDAVAHNGCLSKARGIRPFRERRECQRGLVLECAQDLAIGKNERAQGPDVRPTSCGLNGYGDLIPRLDRIPRPAVPD